MNSTNEQELDKILDILIDSAVEARMRWHKQSQRARQGQSGNSGFTRYQSELNYADNTAKDAIMHLVTAHTNAEIARLLDRLETEMPSKRNTLVGDAYQRTFCNEYNKALKEVSNVIQAERAKLKERDDEPIRS